MSQAAEKRVTRTRCASCAIRERAICAYCEPDELETLDAIKSYRAYAKGSEIVVAGERTPFVASIVSGVVSLSKTLADGRRQVIGLQFQSDFLGGAFRDDASCDAVAASDVLLCQFERAAFDRLLRDTPHLRDRLLDLTLDELDAARDWMTLLGQKTAREKVAAFLLMIAKRSVPPGARSPASGVATVAELPITRAEIGEHLGLTIETVSRQLSKLKAERLIDFETTRRFRIPNVSALAAEAGDLSVCRRGDETRRRPLLGGDDVDHAQIGLREARARQPCERLRPHACSGALDKSLPPPREMAAAVLEEASDQIAERLGVHLSGRRKPRRVERVGEFDGHVGVGALLDLKKRQRRAEFGAPLRIQVGLLQPVAERRRTEGGRRRAQRFADPRAARGVDRRERVRNHLQRVAQRKLGPRALVVEGLRRARACGLPHLGAIIGHWTRSSYSAPGDGRRACRPILSIARAGRRP